MSPLSRGCKCSSHDVFWPAIGVAWATREGWGQRFSKKVHNRPCIYKLPKITKNCSLLFIFIFINSNWLYTKPIKVRGRLRLVRGIRQPLRCRAHLGGNIAGYCHETNFVLGIEYYLRCIWYTWYLVSFHHSSILIHYMNTMLDIVHCLTCIWCTPHLESLTYSRPHVILLIPYYFEYKTPSNSRRIQFLNNIQRGKIKKMRVLSSK
jgi:hypothetical protein